MTKLKLKHVITVEKRFERRPAPDKIRGQVAKLRDRALSGGRAERGWDCKLVVCDPKILSKGIIYSYDMELQYTPKSDRTQPQVDKELDNIVQIIQTAGNTPGWKVVSVNGHTYTYTPKNLVTEEGQELIPYAACEIKHNWHDYYGNIYDREYQINIIMSRVQAAIDSDWTNRFHCALVGEPAGGKALPSDTAHILTVRGWKKIKDVNAGDEVIDPSNGGSQTVTGVFPQGEKPVYKMTFSDRKSVLCCAEHLWFTETRLSRKNAQKGGRPLFHDGRVHATKKIMDTLLYGGFSNHYIPMADCSALESVGELPIDPYLLGLLLGNGCFRQFLRFSTADDEILRAFQEALPPDCDLVYDGRCDYHIRGTTKMGNGLTSAIRQLGLWGTNSISKFVPDRYMFAPTAVRLAILQGLMDTDGTVHSSCPEFNTSSEALMRCVTFIVQSLGGTAKIITKEPLYSYRGKRLTGRTCYRLHINLPPGLPPFRLRRKLEILSRSRVKLPSRSITSVEYFADMDCTCISVSGKAGLFVTDECVVTHNTEVARATKAMLGDMAVLELDATATTQAGVIKELKERTELPRIIIMEEIEKADFKQLPWLLSMLDPRGEIRKLNFRSKILFQMRGLCIATVNNWKLFKGVLEGALASRFGDPIFFPRPSEAILRKILTREIERIRGNKRWIQPTLEFCKEMEITDPRSALSICLSGKDLLLGKKEYQMMLRATRIPNDYNS